MFYDTGEDHSLYQQIKSLSSGINNDDKGLPKVISNHNISFRLMLPWTYSESTYPTAKDSSNYHYTSFLCDMSALAQHKWLNYASVNNANSSCGQEPTYIPASTGSNEGIDGRTLINGDLEPNLTDKGQFSPALFTGFDGYRIVTQEYAETNPGVNPHNHYLCDNSGDETSYFACRQTPHDAMDPNLLDFNNHFINPYG